MILEEQIKKIGLPENQAKIYFSLLENGPLYLQEISKNTNIKRTTLYAIIDKMIENGLLEIEIKSNKKKYYIKDPKFLLAQLKERKYLLEALMPQMLDVFKKKSTVNKIRFYDTSEGLRETLKEMNNLDKEKNELLTIESDIRASFGLGYDFWKDLLSEKKRSGIPSRTIIPSKEKDEFVIHDHNISLRTSTMLSDFNITLYLYLNKAVIMIPRDNICVVIENQKIKNSLSNIFEILWRKAKPFKRGVS